MAIAALGSMALGRVTARTPVATKGLASRPPSLGVALGRVTPQNVGTKGIAVAPPVALGRVTASTTPATLGLAGAKAAPYAKPLAAPANSGAECTEPASTGTMPDGRPKRDLVAVAAYIACVNRQRDRAEAQATPAVSSTPIAYDPGPVVYEPPSSPEIVPGSPQMVSPSWTSPAEDVPAAVAVAAGQNFALPDVAVADIKASPALVVGGVLVLGLLGYVLHAKGVF